MNSNQELSHIPAHNVRALKIAKQDVSSYQDLARLGICLNAADVNSMTKFAHSMDADLLPPLTTASITTPVQFLQAWLPGFVEIITTARKIDVLVGITTQGRWEDEEIVQGLMEYVGEATTYGDYTNVPMSSWNLNYERRTIVRFEEGMQVGRLEEARSAAIRANSAEAKREAAGRALEIIRNRVGFFGYNNGDNRTFGLLNDPELPAYVSVPVGGGGNTEWALKTFLEIQKDIRSAISSLRIQSGDQIDPGTTKLILGLSISARDFLSVTSDFGNSVHDWIKETYPNIRVESVPEFDAANGGENVFYLYAETVDDSSSDDSRTFVQIVPAKFQTLGVDQRAKSYVEDYTNATAGILTKRPYAVYRASGI